MAGAQLGDGYSGASATLFPHYGRGGETYSLIGILEKDSGHKDCIVNYRPSAVERFEPTGDIGVFRPMLGTVREATGLPDREKVALDLIVACIERRLAAGNPG